MENVWQKGEDHSFVSQILRIDHGIEEGDDDGNMFEMSDIPSQCKINQ